MSNVFRDPFDILHERLKFEGLLFHQARSELHHLQWETKRRMAISKQWIKTKGSRLSFLIQNDSPENEIYQARQALSREQRYHDFLSRKMKRITDYLHVGYMNKTINLEERTLKKQKQKDSDIGYINKIHVVKLANFQRIPRGQSGKARHITTVRRISFSIAWREERTQPPVAK